ncbi:MAG: hypothetical protein A3G04_00190 [Candidatus Taylorbacteria bacterium RIFCSPLOWO2_12_FULL_44_9]|nr:MAG: hypothetical protein A3G04_00190 [Candidatus Taylorbacteria bacterium RIFCSPLOWO2_12_FULL_44_9]
MKSRFFMIFRLSNLLCFLFIFAFCLLALRSLGGGGFTLTAFAQIPISSSGLELSASTNNPIPNQKITVTARSYSIDINSAKISWTVNGKVTQNAVGATTIEITAPAIGKKITLEVVATTPEGRMVGSSLVLGSGSIDLILETDGYVPPFFKGKVAPVYQNSIKIIAIPHLANVSGVEYDPKTLIYEWKKNSRVVENQSGYGKQSITLVGDIVPRPYDISVTIWPRDDSSSAQVYSEVSVGNPYITFYVDDPLYGKLFNIALQGSIRIGTQKEVTVLAVPFGFSGVGNSLGNNDLSWAWAINNLSRAELSSNRSVILRAPEGSSGSSNIQLNIKNTDKILQGSTAGFSAIFSNKTASIDETATF